MPKTEDLIQDKVLGYNVEALEYVIDNGWILQLHQSGTALMCF